MMSRKKQTPEQDKKKKKKKRFNGFMRLGLLLITVCSYALLAASVIIHMFMPRVRECLHAVMPVQLSFEAGVLTDIFLFLWGVTQALVMFYMEHKKERILGVTLDHIIQVSIGWGYVVSTLILFSTEMVFWILSVLTDNHYLMSADLFLQLVNITAVFIVIHNKQKPGSVLGTCNEQAAKAREEWVEGKADGIPKLLLFDLLREKNLTTSLSIEDVKKAVANAYAPIYAEGAENPQRRFSYECYLTEKICEVCGDSPGIPDVIKFLFEGDGLADELSQRAVLFHLIRSKSKYSDSGIIELLQHMATKNERHYVWCGIWSIYWRNYSNMPERESGICLYEQMSENATIPMANFFIAGQSVSDYFLAKAYGEWEDLRDE